MTEPIDVISTSFRKTTANFELSLAWARKARPGRGGAHNDLSSHSILTTQSFRTIIVRLISTAQTGFFYTTQRVRQGPRLSAVKYDPRGAPFFLTF